MSAAEIVPFAKIAVALFVLVNDERAGLYSNTFAFQPLLRLVIHDCERLPVPVDVRL